MAAPATRRLSKSDFFSRTGYEPHAGQRPVHQSTTRFRVLCCGRRFGKTIIGGKEAELCAFASSPAIGGPQRGWIVGPEYTDGEKEFRVIYDSLRKQGIDRDSIKFVNNVDSGNMHITTNWGFDVQVRSAKYPDSLVGEGLDFVIMAEAGKHKRKTWSEYIRPTLSDKRGWALFSGVPEGPTATSLLYASWQLGQSTRANTAWWESWNLPSWHNNLVFPRGRQDPEILDAEQDLTEDEFDRQYRAKFVERTGMVLKEFDSDIHIADLDYDPSWETYMAVDYGFTNDFVVLWIQVNFHGHINVIRERRFNELDTPEICKDLLSDSVDASLVRACSRIYPDPAEPDDTRTMVRMLRTPASYNTGGELKLRLAAIRKALKPVAPHHDLKASGNRPRLMVDRSCTKLIWEITQGYRWPETRSEAKNNDPEKPMDKYNHGPEALGRFFKGHIGVDNDVRQGSKVTKARFGGR